MSSRPRAPFAYPRAGRNAPIEVRRAIQAFRRLPLKLRAQTPLLYWLLGDGTPPYKMAPADADYIEEGRGPELCANCAYAFQHVTSREYICSQISGPIQPRAWCRLWVR